MTDETVDRDARPRRRGRRRRDSNSPRRVTIPRTRPLFDLTDFTVDEDNAMLDRMCIRFEYHTLRISPGFTEEDTAAVLQIFLNQLSADDSIFNNPPRDKFYCQITKSKDPLLKSSRVSFRRTAHRLTYRLIIDVRINPTRFIAFGPYTRRSESHFVNLRSDLKKQIKNLTLDKKDNYVRGSYRNFQNFLSDDRPSGRRVNFLSLMDEVTTWFEEKINSITATPLYSVEYDWDNWSISQGEVYFEYFAGNALSTMQRIANCLSVMYQDARFRPYIGSAAHPFETRQLHSSFSVHIKLRGSLKLVIYPKTRHNIRFELRNSRTLRTELPGMDLMLGTEEEAELNNAGDSNDKERWKRSYVTTEFDGMAHMMRIAAHHLAIIIDSIVTFLNEHPDEGTDFALIPRFILFLYDCIEDENLLEAVWTAFATNGFIELTNFQTIRQDILQSPDFATYLERAGNRVTPIPAVSALLIALRQDQNIGLLDEVE